MEGSRFPIIAHCFKFWMLCNSSNSRRHRVLATSVP